LVVFLKKLFAVVVSALLLFGCLGQPAKKNPMELIPEKATGYFRVDVTKMVADPEFASMMQKNSDLQKQLDEIKLKTGVSAEKLREVVAFFNDSQQTADGKPGYSGMIAAVDYDENEVLSALKANGGTQEEFKGVKLVVGKDGTTALLPGVIVSGTDNAARDCVLVSTGELKVLNNERLNLLKTKISENAMISFVSLVKEPKEKTAVQAMPSPNSLAFSADKVSADSTEIKMVLGFAAAKDATDAKTSIEAILSILKLASKMNTNSSNAAAGEALTHLLDGLKMSAENDLLLISATLSKSDLDALGSSGLTQGMGASASSQNANSEVPAYDIPQLPNEGGVSEVPFPTVTAGAQELPPLPN
jgi:hypothetical protein